MNREAKALGLLILGGLVGFCIGRYPRESAMVSLAIMTGIDSRLREQEAIQRREAFVVLDGGLLEKPKKPWWRRLMFWKKD